MNAPRPNPPTLAADLESLLTAYERVQHELLGAAAEQRRALGAADAAALERTAARHRDAADELRRLDALRQRLAGVRSPSRLTDLTARLAEPDRTRLRALGERVRGLAERVAAEQRLTRSVAAAVSAHLDALVRQVARALAPAGTYTRVGAIATGPTIARGIDLRR